MLCARLLKPHTPKAGPERRSWFDVLVAQYGRALTVVLRHQALTLLVAVGTLALTAALYVVIPKGFFPVQDTGLIQGVSEGPQSVSFAGMAQRQQALAAVIEPRVEELFAMVHQVVRESGYEGVLSSGIVLTGGTSIMPGMVEMAEDIFLKPARMGTPDYRGQLADVVRSPRYATVLGLLLEAKKQYLRGHIVTRQD
eukprot:gene12197-14911_t